jgi:stalled ribosome alternative rescue factor ArfA
MTRNPVAKNLRLNRPQIVRPRKGKGAYSRKTRVRV